MYRLIECLTQEHNFALVGVAAIVCLLGSGLTVITLRRLIAATGRRKQIQLGFSSLVTGATIWSTHFIAMLAYDPGVEHGYEHTLTAVSLAVAVFGTLAANACVAYGRGHAQYLSAGSFFGLAVSIMHFAGMSAYQIPGDIVWRPGTGLVSVLLGVVFGIASYNRILFPITKLCWLGGTIFMVLAICAMHFVGMTAFEMN